MIKRFYLLASGFLVVGSLGISQAFADVTSYRQKSVNYSNVNTRAEENALTELSNLYDQGLEILDTYSFLNKNLELLLLTDPLETAKQLLNSNSEDVTLIDTTIDALTKSISLLRQSTVKEKVENIAALYDLIKNEETEEWTKTNKMVLRSPMNMSLFEDQFSESSTLNDYEKVLKLLKYARRLRAAVQHEDNFEHHEVEGGNFYLYNVGTGLFFSDGSDWCTHAALGNPGLEVQLIPYGEGYKIYTGLGGGYLNNRGYTDTGDQHVFVFQPVVGKDNVYNIVQSTDHNRMVAYYPEASVDAGQGNELTVGTEVLSSETGIYPEDLEAQWILVTRKERFALSEFASEDNPVDLTFMLSRPGFNRIQEYNDLWWMQDFGIWEEGRNQDDCAIESWNTNPGAYFSYQLEDMPEGVYKVCIQGFYRNGSHNAQASNEISKNAVFFAGSNEVALPNITEYSNLAPTDGQNAGEYDYPFDIPQATVAFRTGLYHVYNVATVKDGYTLPIGVEKVNKGEVEDWIVADNIRIYYYGDNTTETRIAALDDPTSFDSSILQDDETEEVPEEGDTSIIEDIFEAVNVPHDDFYYNLYGVRFKYPTTPGIYIHNGKKVIIR